MLGLGNPGEKFVGTRHNIGFMVLERFAEHFAPAMQVRWSGGPENKLGWELQSTLSAEVSTAGIAFEANHPKLGYDLVDRHSERRRERTREEGVRHPKVELTLAMPQTYMNLSGTTAKKFAEQRKFRLSGSRDQFLVICDDVTVPFGELRLKAPPSLSLFSHCGHLVGSDLSRLIRFWDRRKEGMGARMDCGMYSRGSTPKRSECESILAFKSLLRTPLPCRSTQSPPRNTPSVSLHPPLA